MASVTSAGSLDWAGNVQQFAGKTSPVRCRNCGLIFTNPRPSCDRLSAFYSGDNYCCHEAAGSSSSGAKAEIILKRISKFLPPDIPRNLLDYGAGGGGFWAHANRSGWTVRGFEPGRKGVENCRRAGFEVTDNLEELPSSEFGVVTLNHVFEHLANPIEVLAEIRRLLAPKGLLFVEVPNAGSLRAKLALPFFSRRFRVDERYRAFPIHLMYYTNATLRKMLRSGGWRIDTTFTLGMGLDEFIVPGTDAMDSATANGRAPTRPRRWARVRRILRDAFLSSGFGENVAAIAHLDN
jgi:SAM-dependent methyltransferase